jgi:hypothetical protein
VILSLNDGGQRPGARTAKQLWEDAAEVAHIQYWGSIRQSQTNRLALSWLAGAC